jgi:hypothetical protein
MYRYCKLIIPLLLFAMTSTGQVIAPRSPSAIQAQDYNLDILGRLKMPVVADTAHALIGRDSLGIIVYAKTPGKMYVRDSSAPYGHKWTQVGSGGGSTDTTSLSARINLKVDSVTRGTDTTYYWTSGTRHFAYKGTISLATLLSVLGYTPLAMSDTTFVISTKANAKKGTDSLNAIVTAGLALKKDKSDSTGPTSYVPRNQIDSFKTTVDSSRTATWAALASKMTNFGSAPGQVQFNFASIPAATGYPTGTTLIVPDSGFHYVDTGSGGTRGWKKIVGGSGGGGGSSLPTGVSPLFLQATGPSTYQFGDPRQMDTISLAYSGQSNAGGGAEIGHVFGDLGDTAGDTRVLIWDYNAAPTRWKVARIGQSPFNTTSPVQVSATGWFYYARYLARKTGKIVKLVGSFNNASSMTTWYNTTTRQPAMDTLLNRITASGITRLDYFWWQQGESDPTMPAAQWTNGYDSIRFAIRRLTICPPDCKFAIVGMPDSLSGSQPSASTQQPTMKAYGYGLDPYVCFINTEIYPNKDTVTVNPAALGGNNLHFTNKGYQKLGEERAPAGFNTIPMRDYERGNAGGVNGVNIAPLHVDVVHSDAAGTGARYTGITTRNTVLNNSTGIELFRSDSVVKGGLFLPNASTSFIGTNCLTLTTTTAHDLLFGRNFTEMMRFNSTGIDISQKVTYHSLNQFTINNSTTNSGAGIAMNGDGSNFGVISTGNSVNAAAPNSMYFYFNNGYKMTLGSNGTRIQDSTTVLNNARSTLEVWGSLGLRIDSVVGTNYTMLSRNNTVLFNTGSTTDTFFLNSSAGILGRRLTIKKTDPGTGTVFIKPNSGQTIDYSSTGILLTGQNAMVKLMSADGTAWYTDQAPASGGSSQPFSTSTALFKDGADATKLLSFNIAGITTATTRTATFPNSNFTVAGINIGQSFTGAQDFTGATTTVASQTAHDSSTKAANTKYVDVAVATAIAGANPLNVNDVGSGRSLQYASGDSLHLRTLAVDGKVPDTASNGKVKINTGPFYVQTADASALTNTTSLASLTGTGVGTLTFASGFFEVGDVITIKLRGIISTDANPSNTSFSWKFDDANSSSTIFNALPASLSSAPYDMEAIGIVRSTGGSGTVSFSVTYSVNGTGYAVSASNLTLATNTSQTWQIRGNWQTASTSNTMTNQLCNFKVEKAK